MAYRSVRVLFSLAFVSALGATVVSEAGVTFATHGHNDLSSFGLSLDLMSIEAFAEAVDVVEAGCVDGHQDLAHAFVGGGR